MTTKKTKYSDLFKNVYYDKKNDLILYEYNDILQLDNGKEITHKNIKFKKAAINNYILNYLNSYNIPTNYVGILKRNIISFENFELLPICVKVINTVNKRIAKIFNLVEGSNLPFPIYEIYLNKDKQNIITESHILALNICNVNDAKAIVKIASKVNAVLKVFFERRNVILNEMICYFGVNDNKYFVVDDFTPISLRVTPLHQNELKFNPSKILKENYLLEYFDYFYNLILTK
ncbi:MAG TPA: phosphoribosylaminoimidazolesuccinocarboxamide synthase [Ignavibacteriales bacterium]|jgi:phosphoribosylaminoimidazole-succinocarboxamide synthase|nr:phosphoribosylaminoimidazolesuccinocarboxamide synthase [Ignavibacteriales bacterium]